MTDFCHFRPFQKNLVKLKVTRPIIVVVVANAIHGSLIPLTYVGSTIARHSLAYIVPSS